MSRFKVAAAILCALAIVTLVSVGVARQYGFVYTKAGTGSGATITIPFHEAYDLVVTGYSVVSDSNTNIVIYGAKDVRIHPVSVAAASQKDVVIPGEDTLDYDADGVVCLQDKYGAWVQWDSIDSRADSTLTFKTNLANACSTGDWLTLVEIKAKFAVTAGTTETVYDGDGILRFATNSPAYIVLENATSLCNIEWFAGYYE